MMCINSEGSPWVHRCGFADIIRTQRTDPFFGGQTYIVCTDHHPNMIKAAEKTPGLRTSCDRCQASKVRCTRSKPSCWRCSQSGQECVYSPLKRTGRPRRNMPPPMSSSAYSPALQGGNADCQTENAPPTQSKQGPAATSNATHTESNPSGRWQAADFPWVYNDLHMNWNTRDLDLQDIKLDGFDDLNPNTAFGDVPCPTDDSSNSSWNSGRPNDRKTTEITTPDFSAPMSPSFLLSMDILPSSLELAEPDVASMASGNLARDQIALQPLVKTHESIAQRANHLPRQRPVPVPKPLKIVDSKEPFQDGAHPGNNTSCQSNSQCYRALSEIMFRLNGKGDEGEDMSLEKLLAFDRDLQFTAGRALACRPCMENQNNHPMIILAFMALDNLLSLFEKQRDAASQGNALPDTPQLLQLEKTLVVGNFTVEDRVKALILRQLVLLVLENLGSVLSQLEMRVDLISRGVHRRMAVEMADDIRRRASLLRGWLQLTSQG